MKHRIVILGLLMLALMAPAMATDITGVWQSTSGSTVKIWCNMQLVNITILTRQGQSYKWQGQWNQFGRDFVYFAQGSRYYCTVSGHSQIVVNGPNGVTYWTRIR